MLPSELTVIPDPTTSAIVAASDKRRFALSEDGLRIRANQGHSVADIDLGLTAVQPPETLYHGTVPAFLGSIRERGLSKWSRQHVHLSADIETATKIGRRRGKPVVLEVAAGAMHTAGHPFYHSANGIWLTVAVPLEFIAFPES